MPKRGLNTLAALLPALVIASCSTEALPPLQQASSLPPRTLEKPAVPEEPEPVPPAGLTDILYLDHCNLPPGSIFPVAGKGFMVGDYIRMERDEEVYDCETLVRPERLDVTIPATLESGTWLLRVIRDASEESFDLGEVPLTVSPDAEPLRRPHTIAHRGVHHAAPENSVAALKAAQDLGCYGSETDIWMSSDGELFIYHESSIDGIVIRDTPSSVLRERRLSNGEKLPTLRDYLMQAAKKPSCRLILEIKDHQDVSLNEACARETVRQVRKAGMQNDVDYISFSLEACYVVAAEVKSDRTSVGFLPSTGYDFDSLQEHGVLNLDFYYMHVLEHPDYPALLHRRGMTVGIWSLAKPEDILHALTLNLLLNVV